MPVLTLVSGSATVKLPSLPATVSVSETFVFTSVLLFGPAAGTLTVALDALVISFWSIEPGATTLTRSLFNVSRAAMTIWISARVFLLTAASRPLVAPEADDVGIQPVFLPLLAFTVVYFVLNSWMIASRSLLNDSISAFRIWRDNFAWLSLNYFGGASVAALLVSYTRDLDYTYLALIVPLLIVLVFHILDVHGPSGGRQSTSERAKHAIHVDDRNFGNGDRREGPDHSRPHSTRSDICSRSAAKMGVTDALRSCARSKPRATARHGQTGGSGIHPQQARTTDAS